MTYPIVVVPGGHIIPIRAKRDSPNGELRQHTYYIRRPGPQSESPQTGTEWDELMRRCLRNNQDELLDAMRDVLAGRTSVTSSAPNDLEQLAQWTIASVDRWKQVTANLLQESFARFPHSYYTVSYVILGDKQVPSLAQYRSVLDQSVVRYTGWPPFWLPTRPGIEPYPVDGVIECWIRPDEDYFADPAHSDFWQASPEGRIFLIRGYDEDNVENPAPGSSFDISVHVWRVGECLLHAESLARGLKAGGSASVLFEVTYTGLNGRRLVSIGNPNRSVYNTYISRQDTYTRSAQVEVADISDNLPEIVSELLTPLYNSFSFFELPANLVHEELANLRRKQ